MCHCFKGVYPHKNLMFGIFWNPVHDAESKFKPGPHEVPLLDAQTLF